MQEKIMKAMMGIIIFYWIYLKFIAASHTWHHDIILCALKMNLPNLTTSLPSPYLHGYENEY